MKVLWISAFMFDDSQQKTSGVWQKSLALELMRSENLILGNIAPNRTSNDLKQVRYNNIQQYAIPIADKKKYNQYYLDVVNRFKPDLIHVWGAENFLKLTAFNNPVGVPVVLFMQGVLDSIGTVLLKNLSFWDVFKTIGIREIISRNNLWKMKNSFHREGIIECKMIKSTQYITTPSEWTKSQIFHLNPTANYFFVNRALRKEFIACEKWSTFTHIRPIIYTSAVGFPLKGLDILLKAISIVKQQFQTVELRIAGAVGRKDFLADGYVRYLLKIIKKYDLQSNIVWLGPLGADEIVTNLQEASVFANPSIIESSSGVLSEAMAVGTPTVVSYAGGMPEFAEHNKEALFFIPMDYKMCAYQILKLLNNPELANELSSNAVKRIKSRHSEVSLSEQHLNIYRQVLEIEKIKDK